MAEENLDTEQAVAHQPAEEEASDVRFALSTLLEGDIEGSIRRDTVSFELVDPTGQPLSGRVERHKDDVVGGPGLMNLTIRREEFEQLSAKTREILTEAALAQERIAKDQEEIELLKAETRETLRRLRAA